MHKPESVLENETHKILWDFKIQTDHLIPARRPDLVVINKKERTCHLIDFAVPADHRVKLKKIEKKDKYLDLAREPKKNMEHEGESRTNYNWCPRNGSQRSGKKFERIGKLKEELRPSKQQPY